MMRTKVSDVCMVSPRASPHIMGMNDTMNIGLRIASYNIRAGLGTDLRRDPARTLATIAALKAQIVVLQEADFRLGHRPSALPRHQIGDTGLAPVDFGGHPDSLGWHGIAMLATPDVEISDQTHIDLPGLEPRGAIIADAQTAIGPVRIVGVHLGLLRYNRRRQLDHLRHSLADKDPRPTLILGDFNEWSVKRGLGRLARDYRIVTPGRSFPARRPLLPLDRIAHSPDLDLTPLTLPPMPKGPHASDHRPILAHVVPIAAGRAPR